MLVQITAQQAMDTDKKVYFWSWYTQNFLAYRARRDMLSDIKFGDTEFYIYE